MTPLHVSLPLEQITALLALNRSPGQVAELRERFVRAMLEASRPKTPELWR